MRRGDLSWEWLLPLLLCGVLVFGQEVLRGEPPPTKPKSTPAGTLGPKASGDKAVGHEAAKSGSAQAEPVKLRIFAMKNQDAHTAMMTAQYLMQGQQPAGPAMGGGGLVGMLGVGGAFGMAGIGGGMPGAQPGLGQLGGLGGLGINGMGFAGIAGTPGFGGIAGLPGGNVLVPSEHLTSAVVGKTKLVADVNSNSLMARGPERDLQVIADLVTVLNAPSKKPMPKVKSLQVFRLKYANPNDVALAVIQLGINARVAPIPGPESAVDSEGEQRFLLIARGTEEQIREIRQVVEAMDVRSKEEEGAP